MLCTFKEETKSESQTKQDILLDQMLILETVFL